jgi:N-acetylglutamate synthase-like GNAT family acetyltransferase
METFSLRTFTAGRVRNLWVTPSAHLTAYVRKATHLHPITKQPIRTFDIANVSVDATVRGKGEFTAWVEQIIPEAKLLGYQAIHVENVLTDRFANWFRQDGRWIETSHAVPSFFFVLEEVADEPGNA